MKHRYGRARPGAVRRILQLCSVSLVAVSFSLSAGATEARRGGTLTVGLESELLGFDVVQGGSLDPSGEITMRAVQEPLVRYDYETGQTLPLLAVEWNASEDQTVWTLRLRDGVLFHDGSPFTAQDVAAHYGRILDPEQNAAGRSTLSVIESVEAVEPLVVRFHLRHPWPAFLVMIGSTGISGPIPSAANVDAGNQNRQPVGTGPFRLTQWSSGDRLVVERFADYWAADEIQLDRVVFRVLPDTQTRYASLQSGEIDVMWTDRGQIINEATGNPALVAVSVDGGGAENILINARMPHLSDQRVRAAIAHAWNQEALVRISWQDTKPVIDHPLGGTVECGNVGYRAYNPERARELLADYGQPVAFEFVHTATARGRELGELLQFMLQDVGIAVTLVPVDQSTLMRRVATRDFAMTGWRIPDSPDLEPQLYSAVHSTSQTNNSGVSTPEMDAAADAMRLATSRDESVALQCEVSRHINEQVSMLWRGGGRYHVITSQRVQNMPTPWRGIIDVTRVSVTD
ncbi:ABC transporter substrate-binding protein [Pararhodobacter zhoushanensis]|uniref:ABC transporter substrate-binding protein n=1 Tax=Pararhodobacter zhoushanensis TaxID=2479545 RepID=UPI0013E09BE7|nr:ABC transporter substrate-binding protein [Pararhodobacter zhoushanensis]